MKVFKKDVTKAIKSLQFNPRDDTLTKAMMQLNPTTDFLVNRAIESLLRGDHSEENINEAARFLILALVRRDKLEEDIYGRTTP